VELLLKQPMVFEWSLVVLLIQMSFQIELRTKRIRSILQQMILQLQQVQM
jgi:hypothetical protein